MSQQPPHRPGAAPPVRYRDRRLGTICTETVPAESALRWLYETRLGRRLGASVFGRRWASALIGWWQSSRWSRRQIERFARVHAIRVDEAELPLAAYASFNSFFTRRLRPGARPFAPDGAVLCAPADGRLLVYPELIDGTDLPVKGERVPAQALLGDAPVRLPAAPLAAAIVRLAPSDYHRFHFCDGGLAAQTHELPGSLQPVNPIALWWRPGLLATNQRAVTALRTDHFGAIVQVEVGAFAVGSIVQTYGPGRVERGQEKGFFQFGGSTVVLLFGRGSVTFDADLVRDSRAGLEVLVQAGERIGLRAAAGHEGQP